MTDPRVQPMPVPDAFRHALPGCTCADAYIRAAPGTVTARAAADAVFGAPPPAVFRLLMHARHAVARRLGLTVDELSAPAGAGRIGPFPVLSESPERLVLGLDDKHLDFRIVVQTEAGSVAGTSAVVVGTVVAEHNALGRAYMTVVKRFHRLISRRMLARAVF